MTFLFFFMLFDLAFNESSFFNQLLSLKRLFLYNLFSIKDRIEECKPTPENFVGNASKALCSNIHGKIHLHIYS